MNDEIKTVVILLIVGLCLMIGGFCSIFLCFLDWGNVIFGLVMLFIGSVIVYMGKILFDLEKKEVI